MTKPIRPDDIAAKRAASIPDFVIEAFNACLAREFGGNEACILQRAVIDEILDRAPIDPSVVDRRDMVFRERWLDVEPIYREHGWDVTYDRPGYNESYDPFFVFRRRDK